MKGAFQFKITSPLRNRLTVDVQHKLIRVKLGSERAKFNFDDALGKRCRREGQADL